MEAPAAEAMMESKDDDALQNMIMKGKRTKRQRPQSPIPFDVISTTCSRVDDHQEDDEEMDDDNDNVMIHRHHQSHKSNKDVIISLPTTSESVTEEEQDMATCLILLAQGREFRDERLRKKIGQAKEQPLTNSAYECKTCNRMFPSFQALGGHRTSHKKLKINPIMEISDEDSSPPLFINKCTIVPPPLSLQLGHYSKPSPKNSDNKSKIHECSICGTEFASGQALGGHMRRHRGLMIGNNNNKTGAVIDTITTLSLSPVALEPDHQENNIKGLCLDLNLPVLEEEPPSGSNDKILHFAAKQTQQDRSAIIYTPPALVECRY